MGRTFSGKIREKAVSRDALNPLAPTFGKGFVEMNVDVHHLSHVVKQEGKALKSFFKKGDNNVDALKRVSKLMRRSDIIKNVVTDKLPSNGAAALA